MSSPRYISIALVSISLAILPAALDAIFDYLELEEDTEKHQYYWLYTIAAACFCYPFYFTNIGFLFIAFTDANRRN